MRTFRLPSPRDIDVRVDGIPAIARVTSCVNIPGSFSMTAETPSEYYGERELEFDLCDRRGRSAAWLERKLASDRVRESVELQVWEGMK